MKSDSVTKVCKTVYTRYPKLQGKSPKVTMQGDKYLLTFNYKDELPGGKTMEQTIRVVADEAGNTIKMSTSRG